MMTVNKLAQYFLLLLMVASAANSNLKGSIIVKDETSNNCPLWHYRSGKECSCCRLYLGVSNCHSDSIAVDNGHCLTWNNITNEEQVGRCLFDAKCKNNKNHDIYEVSTIISGSELNNFTCGAYNRYGVRCSKCIEGHGPAAFSDGITCADCSRHKYLWILVLLFQLAMVTVLYLAVVFLGVKGTASPLNIIITYSQLCVNAVTIGSGFRVSVVCSTSKKVMTVLMTLLGVWNLDFFRYLMPPICVSPSTKTINVLLLDYLVAIYPLLLTALVFLLIELYDRKYRLIVCLSSPIVKIASIRRGRWSPRETILNTCITLILLSYSKLLFVSMNLILPVVSYDCNGDIINNSTALLFDPSIRFLHPEHIPYMVLAMFVIAIFVVLPPLVLLLYPTKLFRCALTLVRFKRWDVLHMVMDVFQGWYKDGTENSLDYRPLSALYMILRIIISCIIGATLDNQIRQKWIVVGLLHVGLGTVFLILKPYKKKWMNHIDGILLLLLGAFTIVRLLEERIFFIAGIATALIVIASFSIIVLSYFAFVCKKYY